VILTDTSVVIDYARGKDAKLAALMAQRAVAVCGIVRAELLCGARDPAHRGNLLTLLATFAQFSIPEAIWGAVGDYLAALRRHGITVTFPDTVIATLGIENDIGRAIRTSRRCKPFCLGSSCSRSRHERRRGGLLGARFSWGGHGLDEGV
jgi:predicted nucleic acid-binding protein